MITQVTYERVYNLGSYESERISATVTVEGAIDAAYDEARLAVAQEHARTLAARQQPTQPNGSATYAEPEASQKQHMYIAKLIDQLGWTSEEFATAANERGMSVTGLTRTDASNIIDWLQSELKQERIVSGWAKNVVGAPPKPRTIPDDWDKDLI